MDIDGAGVIGRLAIIEPERIREPGIRLGEHDEVAGPRMIEADLGAFFAGVDAIDAG